MKPLADKDVLQQAAGYKWDNYVFTTSGKARRWALIFDRGGYEDIQFCTLDDERTTPDKAGADLEANWRRKKTEGEEDIKYLRAVEIPGLGPQHVMMRLPTSSNEGEMFRCVRCACVRSGYANFGRGGYWSPYTLNGPTIAAEKRRSRLAEAEWAAYREFHAPCPGETSTASIRRAAGTHQ
jgi:hypothetical protein